MRNVTTGLYMITAICGLIDSVCFLALGGVFAEMMTGNLLLLAFYAGRGASFDQVAHYVPAIVAFAAGAVLGGRLLRGPQKVQERRVGFAVEWVLIVAATVVAWFGEPHGKNFTGQVVVAMLSLAMGIQNAMVRVHGVPDLATNVMTVTFTGLFADSHLAGGDNRNWRRRALSIGLFMIGAAIGAVLLQFDVAWPLVVGSVVLTVAMMPLMYGETPAKS
jgi:uncharacterized membrane protein YoaK (UPF0700 family)